MLFILLSRDSSFRSQNNLKEFCYEDNKKSQTYHFMAFKTFPNILKIELKQVKTNLNDVWQHRIFTREADRSITNSFNIFELTCFY